MDEMIKVEMPTEEWIKMERNHEIVEDFLREVEIVGAYTAKLSLLEKMDELTEEEQQ